MNEMFSIHHVLPLAAMLMLALRSTEGPFSREEHSSSITLPKPEIERGMPLERALLARRSQRDFLNEPLTLPHVSQLLWAAYGVSGPRGFRTAPSAGALYPLEVYAVAGRVDGLPAGVYRYQSDEHELKKHIEGDKRAELASACLGQSWVADAPLSIVISAVYARTTRRYRERGVRYVHMEVGHASQNVCLQGVSLGIASVVVGAFHDADVKKVLRMPDSEEPLAVIPLGRSLR